MVVFLPMIHYLHKFLSLHVINIYDFFLFQITIFFIKLRSKSVWVTPTQCSVRKLKSAEESKNLFILALVQNNSQSRIFDIFHTLSVDMYILKLFQ